MSNKVSSIAIFHNLPSGGAMTFLNELLPRLEKKYKVDVYTTTPRGFNNLLEYLNYTLFQLPKEHIKIAKEINEKKYDLVFVHHDYLTKSPYILRYLNLPTFYLCHEEPREFYQDQEYFSTELKYKLINCLRFPLKAIDRKNISHAYVVIANSRYSLQKLEQIYHRKIEFLKLGIDTKKFKLLPKNETVNYFLTIGALAKFKGIDFLINVISRLPKEFQYPLVVVGNMGRDSKFLNKLAKEKNVELVHKQKLSVAELVQAYNNATLLLAAAINEPFGLSLLESMSCGTSIIAVNEGGYTEILKECPYGTLVERNEYQFSDAIMSRLKQKMDREKYHRFVEKYWNIDNTINNVLEIFNSYLS